MYFSRICSIILCLALWSASARSADVLSPGDVRAAGAVTFPISCSPSVQADFERGVALLHSFFYEEARRIFDSISTRDPACAMAQWGVAETWWHPIWAPPSADEFRAGQAAVERALALKSTPRERGFIDAIAAYYATPEPVSTAPVGQSCHGPVGAPARVIAYAAAMRALDEKFPDDFEVQVFYALATLSVGYATPTDASLSNQKQAGEILERLWKQNPRHPGVAHYLIHSYDYPALATRALPAAKAYADIAPWVPHALHMPSHIFTRLGMWDASIDSNLASSQASRAYAAGRGRDAIEVEELHALDYLMYSYLQQGRDADARGVLERATSAHETFPPLDFVGAYALAAIPVRAVLEREDWHDAATLAIPQRPQWQRYPFVEALFEYSHALGRARSGDLDGARVAIKRMRELREATTDIKFDYFRRHLDIQAQAAGAWLDHAEGHDDRALTALRAAADAEDALGKHPVTPGALMPAREQLAELLLDMERPRDAFGEYVAELKIYPARFRGLYGAGLAAQAGGDPKQARDYFARLIQQAPKADSSRTEVSHARRYIAESVASAE